jgi:anti-sigma regulatory factor (Ser/Thr protein kinase)
MGQLRAVLHDHLLHGADLSQVVGALHRFARSTEGARAATVCVVELDPRTGALAYCTAGHPPPLVVSADREPRFLELTGAGPLGTTPHFPTASTVLEPGELVLLYTDGVLERPGVPTAQATVDLGRVASSAARDGGRPGTPTPAQRVCQDGLDVLTNDTGYADDITLLAAQRTPLVPPLHLRLPATPDAVRRVRSEVASWLGAVRARALDELTVQHAVGELVANVVEHAYADQVALGDVTVDLELGAGGQLHCRVRDRGHWHGGPDDGPSPARGRGLAMASSLVDDLEVTTNASGTTTRVRHRLTRDAQLLTGGQEPGATSPPASEEPYTADLRGARLRVGGAIDVVSAPRLRVDLERASRGRSRPVDLDLSDVTHLGSAGVQVLHEAESRGSLRISAAAGSPAQHVLQLVNLPYDRA